MLRKFPLFIFIFTVGTFCILNVLAHNANVTNSPPGDPDADTIWQESKDISDQHRNVTATAKATKEYFNYPFADNPLQFHVNLESTATVTASNIQCPNETEIEARGEYELISKVSKFDVNSQTWVEWVYSVDCVTPPLEYRGNLDKTTGITYYDDEVLPKHWEVSAEGSVTNDSAGLLQLGRRPPAVSQGRTAEASATIF